MILPDAVLSQLSGSKATFDNLFLRVPYSLRKPLSVSEYRLLLFFSAFAMKLIVMKTTIIAFFDLVKKD